MYFLETIGSPSNYPPRVGKLTQEQIATRSTWGRVPDRDMVKAAMHVINVVPGNAFTVTYLNELDPGTTGETVGEGKGWYDCPRDSGIDAVHGRGMM